MRIDRRASSIDRTRQFQADLAEAVSADGIDGRVCGENCTIICPHCGSTACQCACSADCEEAHRALSVDPDLPIEPAIVPLVFEMKRLGLFTPCWSCEGHLGTDGTLWKFPRVWFYSDSTTHVRLLADGLKDLEIDKKLSARWQIVVTFSDADNSATTYSLEPVVSTDESLQLSALQHDVEVIARSLEGLIVGQAAVLQKATGNDLAPGS